MMQAAEYGSLHNPVPDRQTVSVLVGGNLLRLGLKADQGLTPNAASPGYRLRRRVVLREVPFLSPSPWGRRMELPAWSAERLDAIAEPSISADSCLRDDEARVP